MAKIAKNKNSSLEKNAKNGTYPKGTFWQKTQKIKIVAELHAKGTFWQKLEIIKIVWEKNGKNGTLWQKNVKIKNNSLAKIAKNKNSN